jgi:hypothetical protein
VGPSGCVVVDDLTLGPLRRARAALRDRLGRRCTAHRPPSKWDLAALIGAASIFDPTGVATDHALRRLLPTHPNRTRRVSSLGLRGDWLGWVELDAELDRRAVRAGLIDPITREPLRPPVEPPHGGGGDSPPC